MAEGEGAAVEKTGVCHELYIWRIRTVRQIHAFHIALCLQSQTASCYEDECNTQK